jgi:hypothetical protein
VCYLSEDFFKKKTSSERELFKFTRALAANWCPRKAVAKMAALSLAGNEVAFSLLVIFSRGMSRSEMTKAGWGAPSRKWFELNPVGDVG